MFYYILSFSLEDSSIIESKLSLLSLICPKTAGANLVEVLKRSVKKPSPLINFLHVDFSKSISFLVLKNGCALT